jgi:hypothetical protein
MFQPLGSSLVMGLLVRKVVQGPIHLNGQARRWTVEVEDIGANGVLTPKAVASHRLGLEA